MLRLAHTQNLLALSPSKEQTARQPAMEVLPLVMEPESRFYADPVVVLDFQASAGSGMRRLAWGGIWRRRARCAGYIPPPVPRASPSAHPPRRSRCIRR